MTGLLFGFLVLPALAFTAPFALPAEASTEAGVCLSTSFQKTDLSDLRSFPMFEQTHHARMNLYDTDNDVLSSSGWALFGGKYKEDPVFLVDLETGKKEEFLPSAYSAKKQSSLADLENSHISFFMPSRRLPRLHGFSESGDYAYALISDGGFKLKNLPADEEQTFNIKPEGLALAMAFREETGSLTLLETSKETARKIRNFNFLGSDKTERHSGRRKLEVSFEEAARSEFREEDLILRKIDLKSEGEERIVIPGGMGELLCGVVSSDKRNLFFVSEDGALYQRPLAAEPWEGPAEETAGNGAFRLFEPVEGFHLGNDPIEIKRRCAFLRGGSNVLKTPDGTGYILRRIQERLEFFMPYEWFHPTLEERDGPGVVPTNLFGVQNPWRVFRRNESNAFFLHYLDRQIRYPFVVFKSWYYHIPDGHFQPLPHGAGKYSSFLSRKLISGRVILTFTKDDTDQALLLSATGPPRILLKDLQTCGAFMEDGRVFIFTNHGELFVVDALTGDHHRIWTGNVMCNNIWREHNLFRKGRDALSFSALVFQKDRDAQKSSMAAVHSRMVCFNPTPDSLEGDIKAVLLETAAVENPLSKEILSPFISLLGFEETIQDHHRELTSALWNILKNSPRLYMEIVNLYPSLSDLPPLSAGDMKADQVKPLLTAAKEILKMLLSESGGRTFASYSPLRPLRPILKTLPKQERDFYIEDITLSLVNSAVYSMEESFSPADAFGEALKHEDAAASSIYPSKLYYLINGHIKELFGLKREPYSDVAVYREKDPRGDKAYNIAAAILSSDPIEGHDSVKSRFGFHYAVLKQAEGPLEGLKKGDRLIDEQAEWTVQGTPLRAKITVDAGAKLGEDIHTLVPALRGPDYESLWRDGRLVGIVAVSTNLRDYTRYIADQYLTYLKEEGFEFSAHYTMGFKDSIAHYIRNGKADWLMYQGHAMGDDRNVFQIDRHSYIIRAVRVIGDKEKISGGKAAAPAHEEIFLVLPRSRKEKDKEASAIVSDFFSVNDLSKAMAVRNRNGGGQLIYFNTTCWSVKKAVYELGAVASSSFVNVATFSPSEIFQSERDGALRALIQSLREGRNFSGFRSALSANEEYRNNLRNRYIFPDEEVYREELVERIQIPMDIHIDLREKKDGKWRKLPVAPVEMYN